MIGELNTNEPMKNTLLSRRYTSFFVAVDYMFPCNYLSQVTHVEWNPSESMKNFFLYPFSV